MADRPDFIKHYSEFQKPDESRYKGDDELMEIRSPFSRQFGFRKLGIHHRAELAARVRPLSLDEIQ